MPEIGAISGLCYFRCSGLSLDNTTTEPPIIHSNQVIADVSRWGQVDQEISLVSMDSCPDIQRGVIGKSGDNGIGINLPRTIGGNSPLGIRGGDLISLNILLGYQILSTVTSRGMVKR